MTTEVPGPSAGRRPPERPRSGSARTIVIGVIALVIVAAVIAAVVFTLQARDVGRSMEKASDTAGVLVEQLGDDPDAAEATLQRLQRELAGADDAAHASVFAAGAHVPIIGPNVRAARKAIGAFTLLSHQALPVLVSGARYIDLNDHTLRGGLSSLPGLVRLTPELVPALTAFTHAKKQIDSIDTADLRGDTKDAITRLQTTMKQWADVLAPFTSAATAVKNGRKAIDVWKNALEGAAD
ncbi:hypothetical protein [Spelaeicoccus albus]|uniref:Uncharacterized protein n=1 Tax=Spelaeicoccus albus TaxID=1280376 RepID=A0A7Z0A7Y2_9MICO|nr:hypothetical protein [Spelaeicoccus albus]NYI66032.1 hypothetical protein [Spelaeicoccus albus]